MTLAVAVRCGSSWKRL